MNLRLLLASSLLGVSLVACNGGGSAPAPFATTAPGATPTPTVPVSQSVTPVITQSGSNAVLSPGLSTATLSGLGLSGQPLIAAPSALSGVVPTGTTAAYGNTLPTSIAAFSGVRRSLSTNVAGATGLIYASFTAPSEFTIPAATSIAFSFPLSSVASGVDYHLAFFDGSTWRADTTDLGVNSSGTVTVTITTPNAVTFSSGTTYAFALYSIASTTATATASPTPTATPLVSGTANVAPTGSTTTNATIATGYTGTVTLPAASASSALAYSLYTSAPTGVTALSGTGVTTVYGYGVITPDSTVVFASGSSASGSITVPSGATLPSGSYYLAYSTDGATWIKGLGTSSVSGNTTTMTVSTTGGDVQLTAGTKYYVAIYQ